jgi:3-methyladenine DNA glycosylase AlkD
LTSEPSATAGAFVEERLSAARDLGERLADLLDEPERFVDALRKGLAELADTGYSRLPVHVAPGSGPVLGVRLTLLRAVRRPVEGGLREGSSATALWLGQRLIPEEVREVRLFALPALARALADDPERTWQALRRLGRSARDWVEVDSQAELWARGVRAERFRWAELELLAYSELPMERRLVAAALACMPRQGARAARQGLVDEVGPQALALVRDLMGDADPMVRKALAWALREWARVDPGGVERVLRDETAIAVEHRDGYRASVVRAALVALPAATAQSLRSRLKGIRSRPGAPATSPAALRAAAFGPLGELSAQAASRQGSRFRGS